MQGAGNIAGRSGKRIIARVSQAQKGSETYIPFCLQESRAGYLLWQYHVYENITVDESLSVYMFMLDHSFSYAFLSHRSDQRSMFI